MKKSGLRFLEKMNDLLERIPQEKCGRNGCEKQAVCLAVGRRRPGQSEQGLDLSLYCEEHANIAAQQGSPEYVICCKACGCLQGYGRAPFI